MRMPQSIKENSLYMAWGVALIAMLGSLFFSNVLGYPPCVLCWYQRITIYPLVIILAVALFYKDTKVYRTALPLAFIGLAINIYHNLLYYKILPESAAPCVQGVSCTTQYVNYFGFITIPFLSFVAFVLIIVLLFIHKKSYANQ